MQFLLKQAGVDKRTGDLFGNRDLLNIARNMARGLKVRDLCQKRRGQYIFSFCCCWHMTVRDLISRGNCLGCRECIYTTPATSIPDDGEHF